MKLNIQLSIKVNKDELENAKKYCNLKDGTLHIKIRNLISELSREYIKLNKEEDENGNN